MPFRLSRPYISRAGAPVIRRVDSAIFTSRYFGACLSCSFCRDACCAHGVDVDVDTAARILAQAPEIEAVVGFDRSHWFTSERTPDADAPGGAQVRTRVVNGACVFLNRAGRGCLLHAFALGTSQDYHTLKPIVSALFPLTFGHGTLFVSDELDDGSLVCGGDGPTVYEAARGELAYYFGDALVAELDARAAATTSSAIATPSHAPHGAAHATHTAPASGRGRSLPTVGA